MAPLLNVIRKILAFSIPRSVRKSLPKHATQHLHFAGTFQARLYGKPLLLLKANHYLVENEIFWYGLEGCHEKKSFEIYMEYCRIFRPSEIYDIGASTGVYGLVAKAIIPEARVSFFEPIPGAVKIIRENLSLNDFTCQVFPKAVSNYDGRGHFYLESGEEMAYSITLNAYADEAINGFHDLGKQYNQLAVKVVQIQSLIRESKIAIPDLVKIDVETHEPEVLEGFGRYLVAKTCFLIEVLTEEKALELNKVFDGFDYEYWNIDDRKGTARRTSRIEKSDYFNYFVCTSEVASKLTSLRNSGK